MVLNKEEPHQNLELNNLVIKKIQETFLFLYFFKKNIHPLGSFNPDKYMYVCNICTHTNISKYVPYRK